MVSYRSLHHFQNPNIRSSSTSKFLLTLRFFFGILITINSTSHLLSQREIDFNNWNCALEICNTNSINEYLHSISTNWENLTFKSLNGIERKLHDCIDKCQTHNKPSLKRTASTTIFTYKFSSGDLTLRQKDSLGQNLINRFPSERNLTLIDKNNLANIYYWIGSNYEQSGFYQKALQSFRKSIKYDETSLISSYTYSLLLEASINPKIELIPQLHELKASYSSESTFWKTKVDLVISSVYTSLNNIDSAQYYLNQIPNQFKIDQGEHFYPVQAKFYKKFQQEDKYEQSLLKQISIKKSKDDTSFDQETELAKLYLDQRYLEKAKKFYLSAKENCVIQNKGIHEPKNPFTYTKILIGLAEINLLQNEKADTLISKARALIQSKFHSMEFQKDKLKLLKDYSSLFTLIFNYKNQLELDDVDLLQFSEEAKAFTLFDELKQIEFLRKKLSPSEFLKLRAFQKDIFEINKKLDHSKEKENLEFLKLKSNLESEVELIVATHIKNKINSKIEVRDFLKFIPNKTVIEYFIQDTNAVALIINEGTVSSYNLNLNNSALSDLNHYKKLLTDKTSSLQKQETLSKSIYTAFLQPLKKELKEDIIIIPHGILSSIPFETLRNEKGEFLLEHHNISYAFSLAVLKEMQKQGRGENQLLGFAPKYSSNLLDFPLAPLAENVNELKKLAKVFDDKNIFNGDKARLEIFKEQAHTADIIHFAAHADINPEDDDYSYLAFTDASGEEDSTLLYLSELYNMDLNAEMIVLSACNTGIGKFQEGEGILSLSRGFAYAGASSVVSTLWDANDASTSKIIQDFYKNLKKGQDKSLALSNAKRTYLSKAKARDKHPMNWAGLVLVGNPDPIFNESNLLIYLLPVAFLLSLLLFFFRKRKKSYA